jgi:hypothetical protein
MGILARICSTTFKKQYVDVLLVFWFGLIFGWFIDWRLEPSKRPVSVSEHLRGGEIEYWWVWDLGVVIPLFALLFVGLLRGMCWGWKRYRDVN